MIDYEIDGKNLILGDKHITFNYDIKEVGEVNGYLIVLIYDLETGNVAKQPRNNIIAVDQNGVKIWTIDEIIKERDRIFTTFRFNDEIVSDPTGRAIIRHRIENEKDENILNVYDAMGIWYAINLSTLKVISKRGIR
jgi:hypothetical protein